MIYIMVTEAHSAVRGQQGGDSWNSPLGKNGSNEAKGKRGYLT